MRNAAYFVLAVLFAFAGSLALVSDASVSASAFSCADVTEIPQVECEALVALYNSTNGPGWYNHTNWLVTNTPSDWYGVTVTAGRVTSLRLDYDTLWGSIPAELGNLTGLINLHLINNYLTGNIPTELGNLINLQFLHLYKNQLSGSIPPTLGNLANLEELDLRWNQISGAIPIELSNLSGLKWLALSDNKLSGNIPSELGKLSNLLILEIVSNQLSGSIPPELGNMASLTSLWLSYNQLSGIIPVELGNLANLTELNLCDNQLSGKIPPELGNIASLTGLWLCYNQLSGIIPPELGNLTNLILLSLGVNQLDGSIPPELGKLNNLHDLYLAENQLSGSIPIEIGNLSNLAYLELSNNQLSGSIPAALGNLTNLRVLWLQGNLLEGAVPAELANLINLYDPGQFWERDGLYLDNNMLNVPPGYPNPDDPLQVFLHQKDPDWQYSQGFQQVIGVGGGELISHDGRTDIVVPPGALITDTTFTYIPLPSPLHDHFGMSFVQTSFELSAEDTSGNPVTAFNLPITVTLTYMDTDFGAVPEDSLRLYYWDVAASTWTDAVMTCPGGEYTRDLVANTLSLPLCHLTEFGLFAPTLNRYIPLVYRQ